MLTVKLTGGNQQIATGVATYRGFSISETSGTASARIRIFEGNSTAGPILDEITLAANESAREYYADNNFSVGSGIYVQVVSGSVSGSVRIS